MPDGASSTGERTSPSNQHRLGHRALVVLALVCLSNSARAEELNLDLHRFQVVKRESGPTNYYSLETEGASSFIRGAYRPPMKTTVLGYEFPANFREGATKLRWRWRAVTLPLGGDECESDRADSAAVVYVTWRSGLRWFTLKYVWSAVGLKGAVCDRMRNPFACQDTVILESGPPKMQWITEEIDLAAEFRKHFRGGNPNGDVPPLLGLGIMTDGDQTDSDSAADYADFVLTR